MWKSIYDYLVQMLSGLKWSAFLAQNNDNLILATKLRNIFRNDLYSIAGMICLVLTLIVVMVYYFIVNRKGGAGYAFKLKYWFRTMVGCALAISLIIGFISVKMTSAYTMLNPFKYTLALSFSNLLYSVLLFLLFSVILKRFSVANTTPF